LDAPPIPAAATRVEWASLDAVTPAARNPKAHNIDGIRASIGRFGFVTPAVVDERTGRLVVGHGRTEALRAMRDDGEEPPTGVRAVDGVWQVPVLHGWSSRSDAEAEAYLIADNQHTIAGGWDNGQLASMLLDLDSIDPTLTEALGFSEEALATIMATPPDMDDTTEDDSPGGGLDDGAMITLAGTTIGEPDVVVATGDVWALGDRHILVVADPHTGWPHWVRFLEGETILLPYPSPLAALVPGPPGRRVLLVQPNKYVAGWLVTKWQRVPGDVAHRLDES
jgi:hypothetical protein